MRKKRQCFLNLVTLIGLAFSISSASAQSSPIDLKSAIEMAMANNDGLKGEKMNISIADYKAKTAKADFLPQVNFSARSEYNIAIPSQMLPGSFVGQPGKDYVPVQFGTRNNMGAGIEVTQNLIRKDLRLKVNGAELDRSISQTRYSISQEDLVFQVATSYYNLQTNGELIRTTEKDYENLKEIVVIAKAQFESGILKKVDYEALQISAANKQSQLKQYQSGYNEQLNFFKYQVGLPVDSNIAISDNMGSIGMTLGSDSQSFKRKDIQLYHQLIESKETEIKGIRAERRPSLNTYFRYNYQSQFNNAGDAFSSEYRFKSSTIGITTTIPIFDGNRRKNRINVAESQLKQLKFQTDHQQHLAKTELASSWETLKSNQQEYEITRENLVLAEKVFTSRKALYAEGVTSLIELLDAEKELTQSRNLHIQAMINVQSGLVDVYKAKGTLLTEFLNSL